VAALAPAPAGAAARSMLVPPGFFGVAPQSPPSAADTQEMRAGGIESVRVPVSWAGVEPTPESGYWWGTIDEMVATAARARLTVLPFFFATPSWLAPQETSLPVDTAAERSRWVAFIRAAVQRYGPGGAFWSEHGPFSNEPLPELPVHAWQIWNEANFHYFTFPVSPKRYAEMLPPTYQAIKEVDPSAEVVLSGLFGEPGVGGPWGRPATKFLGALYRLGMAPYFDAVAVHPYAADVATLRQIVGGVRKVVLGNGDDAALYITEMGWGSQANRRQVSFERGVAGQARELRRAYLYLIGEQARLNLRGVYWFSWKDLPGSCDFCDSVGLFGPGPGLEPKPAWRTFVSLTTRARAAARARGRSR
jgi:hypothetical protein